MSFIFHDTITTDSTSSEDNLITRYSPNQDLQENLPSVLDGLITHIPFDSTLNAVDKIGGFGPMQQSCYPNGHNILDLYGIKHRDYWENKLINHWQPFFQLQDNRLVFYRGRGVLKHKIAYKVNTALQIKARLIVSSDHQMNHIIYIEGKTFQGIVRETKTFNLNSRMNLSYDSGIFRLTDSQIDYITFRVDVLDGVDPANLGHHMAFHDLELIYAETSQQIYYPDNVVGGGYPLCIGNVANTEDPVVSAIIIPHTRAYPPNNKTYINGIMLPTGDDRVEMETFYCMNDDPTGGSGHHVEFRFDSPYNWVRLSGTYATVNFTIRKRSGNSPTYTGSRCELRDSKNRMIGGSHISYTAYSDRWETYSIKVGKIPDDAGEFVVLILDIPLAGTPDFGEILVKDLYVNIHKNPQAIDTGNEKNSCIWEPLYVLGSRNTYLDYWNKGYRSHLQYRYRMFDRLHGKTGWTINFWIKQGFSSVKEGQIISCTGTGVNVNETYLSIRFDYAKNLMFFINNNGTEFYVGFPGYIADNDWHMITVTFGNSRIKTYFDGKLCSSPTTNVSTELFRYITDVRFGDHKNTYLHTPQCLIQQFSIYDRTLSDTEIYTHLFCTHLSLSDAVRTNIPESIRVPHKADSVFEIISKPKVKLKEGIIGEDIIHIPLVSNITTNKPVNSHKIWHHMWSINTIPDRGGQLFVGNPFRNMCHSYRAVAVRDQNMNGVSNIEQYQYTSYDDQVSLQRFNFLHYPTDDIVRCKHHILNGYHVWFGTQVGAVSSVNLWKNRRWLYYSVYARNHNHIPEYWLDIHTVKPDWSGPYNQKNWYHQANPLVGERLYNPNADIYHHNRLDQFMEDIPNNAIHTIARGYNKVDWLDMELGYFMLSDSTGERPFIPAGTEHPRGQLKMRLSPFLIDMSKDFTIAYQKKPVGTHLTNRDGYNIESFGCNDNTVGGGYIYWGKITGKNTTETGNTFTPEEYFDHWQTIIIQYDSTVGRMHIYIFLSNGRQLMHRIYDYKLSTNRYLTQHDWDFNLDGWNSSGTCDKFVKDMILAQKVIPYKEVLKIYKTQLSFDSESVCKGGRNVYTWTE